MCACTNLIFLEVLKAVVILALNLYNRFPIISYGTFLSYVFGLVRALRLAGVCFSDDFLYISVHYVYSEG